MRAALAHLALDPVVGFRHLGVHPREDVGGTRNTPGHDADLDITADQGPSGISLAQTLSITLGAHHVVGNSAAVVLSLAVDNSAIGVTITVADNV